MPRKLLVNALALVVVFVVGGAALAANGVPVPLLADAVTDEGTDAFVLPMETETARPETDTARPDNFGQVRSAEVRAFGECMREADSAEARDACHEAKHGPATENPAHPVFGEPAPAPEVDDSGGAEVGPQHAPPPPVTPPAPAEHGQERAAEAREQRASGQERAEEARAQRPAPDEDPTEDREEPGDGPAPQADFGQDTADAAQAGGGNGHGRGGGRG